MFHIVFALLLLLSWVDAVQGAEVRKLPCSHLHLLLFQLPKEMQSVPLPKRSPTSVVSRNRAM